jgi:glycosyltransferase involved in cell wall biosynthesis
MRRTCTVTVIIPVHNGEPYLDNAIKSVLEQSFADYELLVIDDASTDRSLSIARTYAALDDRIRPLPHHRQQGVAAAQNSGLRSAAGQLIAFLGQDDIALPDRLQQQVAFMTRHPSIALLGSQMLWMTENGTVMNELFFPETDPQIRFGFLLENQIAAPSVMFRADVARVHGLTFDSSYDGAEDYALWCRFAQVGRTHNLLDPLVNYRVHPRQISATHFEQQQRHAGDISAFQRAALGVEDPSIPGERQTLKRLYRAYLRHYRRSRDSAVGFIEHLTLAPTELRQQVGPRVADSLIGLQATHRTGLLQRLARSFLDKTGFLDAALALLADAV